MKHQMIKPYSFLLYILILIFCFILGASSAAITSFGKNLGLAGGATVVSYGVLFASIGLIIALFIANKTNKKLIIRLNIFIAVCIFAFYLYFILKK